MLCVPWRVLSLSQLQMVPKDRSFAFLRFASSMLGKFQTYSPKWSFFMIIHHGRIPKQSPNKQPHDFAEFWTVSQDNVPKGYKYIYIYIYCEIGQNCKPESQLHAPCNVFQPFTKDLRSPMTVMLHCPQRKSAARQLL